MEPRWTEFFLGGGAPVQQWVLLLSFAVMLWASWYAGNGPEGPSGGPFIVYGFFLIAFAGFLVLTPFNAARWVAAAGLSRWINLVIVPAAIGFVWYLWTFAVWGTDPNYPERIARGRLLLPLHSTMLYLLNLYFIWRRRAG
jgi:hypothetical protein